MGRLARKGERGKRGERRRGKVRGMVREVRGLGEKMNEPSERCVEGSL